MSLAGKRVLYISYNGMLDPLGQSQVIPYVKELSKLGVRFWLLSYERAAAFTADGFERRKLLQSELSESGIDWQVLKYHQKPSLPATAYDVALGARVASQLARRNEIDLIHARAHIPAVIAERVKRRLGIKTIFDVRGLMAEEYIDAGHWKAGGVPARLTKTMEARVLRSADGIVTLTDALWNSMQDWPSLIGRTVAHETIPCCIDLEKFQFDEAVRASRRQDLRVADRFVLVYSGSIGGWYNTNEMAEFFAALKRKRPNAFFLWLTQGREEIVTGAMTRVGFDPADYAVRSVEPRDVPGFLSAADAGIALYRPGISRLGTSPVKVSEYLACGLPVIVNSGIGDTDQLVEQHRIGALIHRFQEADYLEAATMVDRLAEDSTATRTLARRIAEESFDVRRAGVEGYQRLYQRVLGT
jgi:glycosyltransferase involved in cell wall biosynthesis